jgi:hypothetical protein
MEQVEGAISLGDAGSVVRPTGKGRKDADFAQTVKDALRKAAGNACSICETHTGGSDNIGKAAHIYDASTRDAIRPHPAMDAPSRSKESNGIWLCGNCHDIVDGRREGAARFPPDRLLLLKAEAERRANRLAGKPIREGKGRERERQWAESARVIVTPNFFSHDADGTQRYSAITVEFNAQAKKAEYPLIWNDKFFLTSDELGPFKRVGNPYHKIDCWPVVPSAPIPFRFRFSDSRGNRWERDGDLVFRVEKATDPTECDPIVFDWGDWDDGITAR